MQTKTSANFYWVDIFSLITNFYKGMEEKHAETSQSYYLGHPFYLLCVCALCAPNWHYFDTCIGMSMWLINGPAWTIKSSFYMTHHIDCQYLYCWMPLLFRVVVNKEARGGLLGRQWRRQHKIFYWDMTYQRIGWTSLQISFKHWARFISPTKEKVWYLQHSFLSEVILCIMVFKC